MSDDLPGMWEEADFMGGEADQPTLADRLAVRTSVAANAIGWAFFGDPNSDRVTISDEDIARCDAAAVRVLAQLAEYDELENRHE